MILVPIESEYATSY